MMDETKNLKSEENSNQENAELINAEPAAITSDSEEKQENVDTGILNALQKEYLDYIDGIVYQRDLWASEIFSVALRILSMILTLTTPRHPYFIFPIVIVHFLIFTLYYVIRLYRDKMIESRVNLNLVFKFSLKKSWYGLFLPTGKRLKEISVTNIILLGEDIIFLAYWTLEDLRIHVTMLRRVIFCVLVVLEIIVRIYINMGKSETVGVKS